MAVPKTFRGARWKLHRAKVHTEEAREALNALGRKYEEKNRPRVTHSQFYWARGHCIVVLATELAPFSRRAAVILGDALQNLNSALEHIAWELVARGTRPPETLSGSRQRKVHFPLETRPPTRNRTWGQICDEALPGVGRPQLAVVRRFQPFRGGKRHADLHRLRVIRDLADVEKHRIIQPLYHRAFDMEFKIRGSHDFQPRRQIVPAGAFGIEFGTELGRIFGRRIGPDPRVQLEVTGGVEPSFERGWWASDSLTMGRRVIGWVIRELEATL